MPSMVRTQDLVLFFLLANTIQVQKYVLRT
jgi:hypothetical protein